MTRGLLRFAYTALCAGSLSLVSCGGGDGGNGGTPDAGGNNVTYTGTFNHYITSSVKLGSSTNEADGFAFDIDGKAPAKDNVIGHVLAGLNTQLMVDASVDAALKKGTFVILHSIRSDDATLASDSTVSWQLYVGTPYATGTMPKFDGSDTPSILSGSSTTGLLGGSISGGLFCSAPGCSKDGKMGDGKNAGTLTVSLSLTGTGDPITLTFYAARLEAKITANGCTEGRIGGGVKSADITSIVLPAVAKNLDDRIAADAGCRDDFSMCTPDNQTILGVFDTDSDRHITVTEVQNNTIVKSVLTPDLDLLPEKGPGGTTDAESVSIALGFGCSKATFTAANEK
jgi:hypothetical protein